MKSLLDKSLITIFTPTYNRASLLPRMYESLINQTNKKFVWLVVDDGSTDNTSSIIHNWVEEGKIDIKYIFQENAGKMKAHNRGVRECQTELFMCLDSDDYLSKDCIEQIYFHWGKYRENPQVSGMVANKKILGQNLSSFPTVELSTLHDLQKNNKMETALAFRTEILRNYQFPELDNEKFISEKIVYDQLDQKYVLGVVPECWMICEYRNDGYTVNMKSILINNPKGWMLNEKQRYDLYGNCLKSKIRIMSTYICASLFAGNKFKEIVYMSPNRALCVMCIPLGWMQKIYNQIKATK